MLPVCSASMSANRANCPHTAWHALVTGIYREPIHAHRVSADPALGSPESLKLRHAVDRLERRVGHLSCQWRSSTDWRARADALAVLRTEHIFPAENYETGERLSWV